MLDPHKERPIDFRIFKDLNIPEVSIPAGNTIVTEGDDGTLMYMIRQRHIANQQAQDDVQHLDDSAAP